MLTKLEFVIYLTDFYSSIGTGIALIIDYTVPVRILPYRIYFKHSVHSLRGAGWNLTEGSLLQMGLKLPEWT
jgi:hypothetical protein